MPEPVRAYVALGSNLGDRAGHLKDALAILRLSDGITVVATSRFVENPAVGGESDSPAFINAAVALETTLNARRLLDRLLEIERELGRVRRLKWGPRSIDLDLVLFGEQVIDEAGLTVPHPLMHERRFVLEPLADIAPDTRHPVLRKSVAELLASL